MSIPGKMNGKGVLGVGHAGWIGIEAAKRKSHSIGRKQHDPSHGNSAHIKRK